MAPSRALVVGCAALLLGGCTADGGYIVKGRVHAGGTPIEGAVVRVSGIGGSARMAQARPTGQDGKFELAYYFSGFGPAPALRADVEASGYAPASFPLQGSEARCVIRRECNGVCLDLDIDLQLLPTQP